MQWSSRIWEIARLRKWSVRLHVRTVEQNLRNLKFLVFYMHCQQGEGFLPLKLLSFCSNQYIGDELKRSLLTAWWINLHKTPLFHIRNSLQYATHVYKRIALLDNNIKIIHSLPYLLVCYPEVLIYQQVPIYCYGWPGGNHPLCTRF